MTLTSTFSVSSIAMVLGALAGAGFALSPRLLKSRTWRAVVTPLASIIGSGFLVAGPILGHVAGSLAFLAMAALCAVAYLFGSALRYNIAERARSADPTAYAPVHWLEHASAYALAFAYFISVAYYINLFAAFALKGVGIVDPAYTRIGASVILGVLGLVGTWRGLRALEKAEILTVGLKLALIGGLMAALVWFDAASLVAGEPLALHTPGENAASEIGILLALLILVQGFETSRYLGESYDAATRIRTMRYAQWLSSAIYVLFIFLVTPLFPETMPKVGGETQIIDILAPLGLLIAPFIIVTALASQLSAAIADMNGASGLLHGTTHKRVSVKTAYFITAVAAIAVSWSSDIFGIIAYASKAFVLYYGLQSLIALLHAWRAGEDRQIWRVLAYGAAIAIAVVILIFGEAVAA